MWCQVCHREVKSTDDGESGATCSLCGHSAESRSKTDAALQAREILERWKSSDLFDLIACTAPLPCLQEQDRSPLLHIPQGSKADVTVAGRETQKSGAEKHGPLAAESQTTTSQTQDFWKSLVAPQPLLVATAPSMDDEQLLSRESTNAGDNSVSGEPAGSSRKQTDRATAVFSGSVVGESTRKSENLKAAEDLADVSNVSKTVPEAISQRPVESEEPASVLGASDSADTIIHNTRIESDSSAIVDSVPFETEATANERGVETIPTATATDPSDSEAALNRAQSVYPAPVSICEESASASGESAESANQSVRDGSERTKKKQRVPLRRPPLHRRFHFDRSDTERPSGRNAVTRNIRIDQVRGGSDNPQSGAEKGSVTSSVSPEARLVSNSPKPGQRLRIDAAESVEEITSTDGRRSRTSSLPKQRYIDEGHEHRLRGPHFEISAPRRSNFSGMIGQFLAYLGVLGLTIGTAIVIYGHFGGYAEYTPTGWLVTTVAQMLLFLGVINLVSGGIEQNNEDVSRKINSLGEQLARIEQVTAEVLSGPKIQAQLYSDPNAEVEKHARETVVQDSN